MQNQVKNNGIWLEQLGDAAGNVQVVGAVAAGQSGIAVNPLLIGGIDGNGNLQPRQINRNVLLLPSATRNSTNKSALQSYPGLLGAIFYFIITEASGTGGVQLNVMFIDPVSMLGNTYAGPFPSSPRTNTTNTNIVVYPATLQGIGGIGNVSAPMPLDWQVQITHLDNSDYMYSVSADLFFA